MKKVILRHRFQLSCKALATVVLFLYLFTGMKQTAQASNEVKYITDEQLKRLYLCKNEQINDTCLVISVEDAEILMKIAVLEDYTDEVSQAYIMSIILNRVESPDFPNTVREVVEQEGQFLKLTDKRYLNAEPDVNSHLALAKIESKEIRTNFLFYEAQKVKNSWASRHRKVALEYGGSRFYE